MIRMPLQLVSVLLVLFQYWIHVIIILVIYDVFVGIWIICMAYKLMQLR